MMTKIHDEIYDLELGNGGPQERDWRGIATALLVIMFICSLIALAVYLFTPMAATIDNSQLPVNLTTMGKLRSPVTNVRFFGNDAIVYENIKQGVMRLSLEKMETETLLDRASLFMHNREESSFDLQYFALFTPTTDEVHRKFNATYKISILNRETLLTYKVGVAKTDDESQRIFKWNPTGNDYVFWQDGHLYYSDSAESATSVRISNGGPNWEHGIFDWLYEEEIFGRDSNAVWWSKKGEQLAFLSREKTKEKSVLMTSYSHNENYPIVVELPYPKTHEKHLPTYVINLWHKKTRELKQMDVQLRDSTAFHYLYGVRWVVMNGEEVLVATWANRLQTHISVTLCDHTSGICKLVFEHKYPNKMWAEPGDFATILSSDDAIYMLLPRAHADGNSYQHIAKLVIQRDSTKGAKDVKWAKSSFLSLGNFDVVDLNAYDKDADIIYFTASAPSPTNRHLYYTKGSPTTTDAWACVSCRYSNCTYQSNVLSPDFKHIVTLCKLVEEPQTNAEDGYILLHCNGPAPPHFYMGDIVEGKADNLVEILNDEEYEKRLATTMLPLVISETIPLKQGYEACVRILLPPDQPSRSSSRSLPVLLKVYAGPGPQMASDEFTIGFEEFLVTTRNFAVVLIDGRGSNGRGWRYRSAIYGALGTVEIEDQIEGIRQVMKKYPFLDTRRLSVFGWSYGGFAAALMSERAPESFFKCAISVAPVANFLYYDATYTERYMGNADKSAYVASDISLNVSNFKKTRLLLIHGMYDDNVHFQHSALFIEALQRNDIDFDVMVYPNQDHALSWRNHLYHKMTSFLDGCAKR